MEWLAIFIGGGMGSLARFGMTKAFASWATDFPVATLLSNLLACLILGFVAGLVAQKAQLSPLLKLGITTGFCGGFSTFSTFGLESVGLLSHGKMLLAGVYVLASVVLCFVGIWVGQMLAKQGS
jgi:fluoride exporter